MVEQLGISNRANKEVTIDPNASIKRQSIQGYVTLKRKAMWVKRFVSIKSAMFSYSKDRGKHEGEISSPIWFKLIVDFLTFCR